LLFQFEDFVAHRIARKAPDYALRRAASGLRGACSLAGTNEKPTDADIRGLRCNRAEGAQIE
jgi:hypothetical protein